LHKEVVELLRRAASDLPCDAEDLAALGERALALLELEDVVGRQWPSREERKAVHRKLLCCGIDSPQSLLRSLSSRSAGRCSLNDSLDEAGFKCLLPETIAELTADLETRIRQRVEVLDEGRRPVLITAPHNIYLRRDGQPPHVMEEYTTLIAQRLARTLYGTCLTWSRAEQRRTELLWFLSRHCGDGSEAGAMLDPRNRDPNYLTPDEVLQNPWFKHMAKIADQWQGPSGQNKPTLHVDIHGCKDPPATPSHLTVGLGALRREADAGRGIVFTRSVDAFAASLESELGAVLSGMDLRPRATLVRVLLPSPADDLDGGASAPCERLSGAWAVSEGRVTQSQQAVSFAGFSHSCQLEMSQALRRTLTRDDAALARFARAVSRAWALALEAVVQTPTSLPALKTGTGNSTAWSSQMLRAVPRKKDQRRSASLQVRHRSFP